MDALEKALSNLTPEVRLQMSESFRRLSKTQLQRKNTALSQDIHRLYAERKTNPSSELDKQILALAVEVVLLGEHVANLKT